MRRRIIEELLNLLNASSLHPLTHLLAHSLHSLTCSLIFSLTRMAYLIEWNRPFTHISAKLEPVAPDTVVLPDWYVNKDQPPLPTPPPSTPTSTWPRPHSSVRLATFRWLIIDNFIVFSFTHATLYNVIMWNEVHHNINLGSNTHSIWHNL